MEPVVELEAAIADAGLLLARANKYRFPEPAPAAALERRLLELGDASRRASRRGALDDATAAALASEVRRTVADLHALLAALRASEPYRAAVAALQAGRTDELARRYATIFTGLTAAPPPAVAWYAPPWQRRGRPLEAAAVAETIDTFRREGVPAEGDDESAGSDAELPGVPLACGWPPGAPIALRYERAVLPSSVAWLGPDELVVPGRCLARPFAVAVAPAGEALDEWVAEPDAYRHALADACVARGLPVDELAPAASS